MQSHTSHAFVNMTQVNRWLKIQSRVDMKIGCFSFGETYVCLACFPFCESHKSHKRGRLVTATSPQFTSCENSRKHLLRFFLGPPGLVILLNFEGMLLFSLDVVLSWILLSHAKASPASTGKFLQRLQQGRHPFGRGFGRDSEPQAVASPEDLQANQ